MVAYLLVAVSVELVEVLLVVVLVLGEDAVKVAQPSVSFRVHGASHLGKSSIQEVFHFSNNFLGSLFCKANKKINFSKALLERLHSL